MITISWSFGGRAGNYGEIVSALCHAQNQSEIYDSAVTLVLNWDFSKSERSKMTCDTMVDYIISNIDFGMINVIHQYGSKKFTKEDHVKQWNKIFGVRSEQHPMQDVYFPPVIIEPKYTVVCSTINNIESFDTYAEGSRKWKDVLTKEQWQNLIDQPNTVHVDYRMPPHVVIEILQKCKMFIGYHGSCAWLARMIGVPLIIYSGDDEVTDYCFPWRLNPNSSVAYDVGLAKIEEYKIKRNDYIHCQRMARLGRTSI